jgi:ABC-type glutathione transport system ATPase component
MTKYINRQRKRAEKVCFTELKRRQHMSVILETKQLCKFYGAGENQVKAVNQVDIQIEQGEFVAIVGKSGSGKSTLLPLTARHLLRQTDHNCFHMSLPPDFSPNVSFHFPQY